MIIRTLTQEDIPAAKALWGYAFETQEPFYTWYFDKVLQPHNLLGLFMEDHLAACLQLNPYPLSVHGSVYPASYIVGVITDPAYRGKGVTKALMEAALEEMNRKGHALSILMPFDTTFYSTYGWELCYSQLRYEVPIDILKNFGHLRGNFRSVQKEQDAEALTSIYQEFLTPHHGYILRAKKEWEVLLEDLYHDGGYAYLLTDETGRPVGYCLYFIKDRCLSVREMAYSTYEAKKSLFGFLYSHKSQVTMVEWSAPLGNQDFLFLRDTIKPTPTNTIKILPFMCGRVVNVEKALSECRYDKSIHCSYAIGISDPHSPWNNKIFSVTITEGIPRVKEGSSADLSCTINTFSRLFFGAINLEQALFMDEVTVHHPAVLEEVSKLFPQRNNYINEYF